ncbi:MAG TPA: alpha/beta hydrolase-fold protein, partial [Flavipsychrobacter sp.]|nr:alpha/beta hydrolase-fold protein [Flavipsychrobacter sp.]
QPYIEKNFSVNDSKTIIGESLGGLLATEILLKEPTLFNKYIIVSPSLWWDNGSLLNYNSEIYNADFHNPLQIYIGVGKEGLTPGKTPRVQEVDANVLADKIENTKSKTIKKYFDYLPQETHATISHQAVFNAIKDFAPVNKE